MDGLGKFMAEQAVSACAFFGIGASSNIELAFYNPHVKDYRKKSFYEDLEIISFSGNGGLLDGTPALHAHGSFGRNDFSIIGGHVSKLVVSVTCEIFLTKMDGALQRLANADLNLNLLT